MSYLIYGSTGIQWVSAVQHPLIYDMFISMHVGKDCLSVPLQCIDSVNTTLTLTMTLSMTLILNLTLFLTLKGTWWVFYPMLSMNYFLSFLTMWFSIFWYVWNCYVAFQPVLHDLLFCLWDDAYKRTLLIRKNYPCGDGFPLSRYLNGPLPYVWRHIVHVVGGSNLFPLAIWVILYHMSDAIYL